MVKNNIIILGIHQSYVRANAGGYIRLKEFIKYIPKDFEWKIIDLYPSIYDFKKQKNHVIEYVQPKIIYLFLKKFFVLGVLSERIYSAYQAYRISCSIIEKETTSVIYVPIGEFLHLYLPAVLLKKKYPHLRLVVDILNFKIYKNNFISVLKYHINKSNNSIAALSIAILSYTSFMLVKMTINTVDYIFTVSPQLIQEIKKIYKRTTIDFTPSGVNVSGIKTNTKKYLGVYVGRITEQKGIFNLIQVWKEVVRLKPDAKLIIAGLVTLEMFNDIKKRLVILGINNNVELKRSITDKEKIEILNKSQIFLHLASYEPLFPVIGILEGLSAGLPVIVYDMPVLQQELPNLKKNNFIFVINNNNFKDPADKVLKLFRLNKKNKNEISLNAVKYAKRFDWHRIAEKEWKCIRNLK